MSMICIYKTIVKLIGPFVKRVFLSYYHIVISVNFLVKTHSGLAEWHPISGWTVQLSTHDNIEFMAFADDACWYLFRPVILQELQKVLSLNL